MSSKPYIVVDVLCPVHGGKWTCAIFEGEKDYINPPTERICADCKKKLEH